MKISSDEVFHEPGKASSPIVPPLNDRLATRRVAGTHAAAIQGLAPVIDEATRLIEFAAAAPADPENDSFGPPEYAWGDVRETVAATLTANGSGF